tara:strand:+ start:884 stop:1642 length:759 start_codon:yes stop_codon:yes gene_type:complete
MSKITLPTFTEGTVADADTVYGAFYDVGGDSLEVINGRLDADNLSETPAITYENIQYGALSGGGMVAGTSNLDFFGGGRVKSYTEMGSAAVTTTQPKGSGWFRSMPNTLSNKSERYLTIPGASVQFFLPYKAKVLLTWTITWVTDSAEDEKWAEVSLFIDGNHAWADEGGMKFSPYARKTPRSVCGIDNSRSLMDRYKARTWSGHYFAAGDVHPVLDAGWHSASLRVGAHGGCRQTRVRARSMKYMYFKHEE